MKIRAGFAIWIAGIGLFFLGCLIVLFFWGDFPAFNSRIDSEEIGQLGDIIGGLIGPIWALAGVIFFYVALTEQRRDFETNRKALETQIREFELQRVELAETRKVFIEQSETLKQQRFENTFFNMLNTFNSMRAQITTFRNSFVLQLEAADFRNRELNTILKEGQFTSFYNNYEHFFQFSEMLLNVIIKSDVSEKKYYGQIFYAMLTKWEKTTLFYYGLTNRSNNLKNYIEELGLFTNDKDVQILAAHRTYYKNLT